MSSGGTRLEEHNDAGSNEAGHAYTQRIGRRLKNARLKQSLSQQELAENVDVEPQGAGQKSPRP